LFPVGLRVGLRVGLLVGLRVGSLGPLEPPHPLQDLVQNSFM
jgi:hypothetical protein